MFQFVLQRGLSKTDTIEHLQTAFPTFGALRNGLFHSAELAGQFAGRSEATPLLAI